MIQSDLSTPTSEKLKTELCLSIEHSEKKYLARKRLLEHLGRQYQKYSIIVLQGQTGQGKTVLAQQFVKQKLQHQNHIWQTLTPTDREPTHFIQHLLSHLQQALSYFHHQQQPQHSAEQALANLLHDLGQQLSEPFYLLLDDLYQLIGSDSEALLLQLLQHRPDNLQLILLSRHQLHSLLKQHRPPAHWLVINNQQHAFNHDEVKQLYAQHFEIYLSDEENQLIYQHTQGWPQGIETYAQNRQEKEMSFKQLIQQLDQSHSFYDTFQNTFNQHISSDLQEFALKISFLDQVTPELASTISDDDQAAEKLQRLLNQHIFIAPPLLGQDQHQLMPLWRSFLRQQASQKLGQKNLARIHQKVAYYWQQHNDLQQALLYYLKAHATEIIEPLLAKKGARILNLSQNQEVRQTLHQQLEEHSQSGPWLALLMGAELSANNPPLALHSLQHAMRLFQQQHNPQGELLARVQQLYFHLCIDGDQQQLHTLLPTTEQLFKQIESELSPYDQIYSASLLTLAQTLIQPTHASVYELDRLIQLSHSHKLHELELHLHLCRLLEQMLKGQLELAKRDLEQLHLALAQQQGSALERALIFTTIAFYLSHTASYPLFEQFLQQNKRLIDPTVLQNSLCAPLLQLWHANAHLAQGREDLAIPALRQAIGLCQAAESSPLHQHLNNLKKHLTTQAAPLCDSNTTPNLLIQAIAQSQQHGSTADGTFAQAAQQANEQHNDWLLSGVLMHWSAHLIQKQQKERAAQTLHQLVPLKQSPSRSYLFMPEVARRVFCYAVTHKIETTFYRQRATQQVSMGFSDKGEAIPLLKIRSLGKLNLLFDEELPLRQSELTPKQQILLALLIASSELHLDQSTVLQALWPETSEGNSRHKLDVMLSRFRSLFNKSFQPQKANHYISLKHGVLSLHNVEVDIHHFSKAGELGLKLYKRGDHWQASLELQSAIQQWRGRFCPGIATLYSVSDLRENLLTHYHRYCIALADIHERCQRYEEASELLLPIFNANSGDESLVACTLPPIFQYETASQSGASAAQLP
ncbi:MAG: AAA family ATPase [Gammaproteobacteria bacterium]|nr:AAA family ATPase [Gammaproteobacteria bacterium]